MGVILNLRKALYDLKLQLANLTNLDEFRVRLCLLNLTPPVSQAKRLQGYSDELGCFQGNISPRNSRVFADGDYRRSCLPAS